MSDKRSLRQRLLQVRNQLAPGYMSECSEQICRTLVQLPIFQEAESILFYMPFRNEVDVKPAMNAAWKQGKEVILPKAYPEDRSMRCFRVKDLAELKTGAYGIAEPPEDREREVKPRQIPLVIVPGVAFDREGYRLGYGGGYYDRFFAAQSLNSKRVGVAFPEQIVETVFPEEHDQRMDVIITSHELFTLSSR
ncbi:5-formyltetrahydrofolate cyclo-ligase [Lihuaxuella thermophila]|uniref:5-formyltetrahydrofolate cyclo-ligase n=1 Tax=Lihuaxuella thermophila TaxID=1173111 RepID=A0A1H8G7T0_9BACL|nr:5-formyltetrahydrofolate cyclo-ligase [Lihuaxuella thermophila]SEN40043.1 5-formyltetrahydrofolate cyclo-ligase [Lihuaxuella thermophila]